MTVAIPGMDLDGERVECQPHNGKQLCPRLGLNPKRRLLLHHGRFFKLGAVGDSVSPRHQAGDHFKDLPKEKGMIFVVFTHG